MIPLRENLHCRQVNNKKMGGIDLPDNYMSEAPQALVLASGEGYYQSGQRIPNECKPGDIVIYTSYCELPDGTLLISEANVRAIVSRGNPVEELETADAQ